MHSIADQEDDLQTIRHRDIPHSLAVGVRILRSGLLPPGFCKQWEFPRLARFQACALVGRRRRVKAGAQNEKFESMGQSGWKISIILCMVAAKRVRKKIADEYGIYRIDNVDAKGNPVRNWYVNLTRQGQEIIRQFFDGIYGDEKAALMMARAYRDAVMRLLPPLTQRQLSIKPRSTNTSGAPGVHAIRKRGQLVGWKALVEFQGRTRRKSFFIRDHGEERAKALAVAERMRMLQSVPNRFATVHPHATDSANKQFANVLEDVASAPKRAAALFDPVAIQKHLQALDAWFDALKPQQVHVRVNTYLNTKRGHLALSVMTSDGRGSARLKIRTWSLLRLSYEQRLPQAWDHIKERLTELLGEACWRAFERDHQQAFFASNPTDGFHVRYRYDRPDGDLQRLRPPPELLPMLEGFVVPELPVSKENSLPSP